MPESFSNTTPEEAAAHRAKLEAQRTCPTCGAERDKAMRMHGFEQGIVQHIREQRLVKRDSCILCVEKHIGKALVLYKELLTAAETNNVNVELNHLEIIGNLQAATDEAEQWPELHKAIDTAEREYRYKGNGPDWREIFGMIQVAKNAVETMPTEK
jgi:hypothetical protein